MKKIYIILKKELNLKRLNLRLGGFLRNKKISNYIYIDKITLTFNNNQGEVNLINGLVLNKKSTDDKFDFKYFIKKNFNKMEGTAKSGDVITISYLEITKEEYNLKSKNKH